MKSELCNLTALRTGSLYPLPRYSFVNRLIRTQGHNAAGGIKSVKNSNDPIGNRTRDLPAYNAVPQPSTPPRTPISEDNN